jgi:hemerythrin superfamily protein
MDVREQLRHDHVKALAELDAVSREADAGRCQVRLARLRRAWMIHALAEETVVYRGLEGLAPGDRADERFVEHELVESMFEKLTHSRAATLEFQARVNVLRELMSRHIQTEEGKLFADLAERYSAAELVTMGEHFVLARDKLGLLEDVKKEEIRKAA